MGPKDAVAPGSVAAVIGCGAMGRGIAQLLAEAELTVRLFDLAPGAAISARSEIAASLARLVARGKRDSQSVAATVERLVPVSAISALAGATIVVEAVAEDLEAKRRLFAELELVVGQEAILATNTSSLSVAAIAAVCSRPERVAGLHFFNPAPVMKVVEVVAAVRTDGRVCDALAELVRRFGHEAVRATDTPGFIVNHAGRGYVTEGLAILAEGVCSPSALDAVLRDACGFKLGPCELLDLTGLDVSQPVMESIYHQYFEDPRYRPQVLTRRMLEGRLLGRKSGTGFYSYVDGKGTVPADPEPPSQLPPRVWIDPTLAALAGRARSALGPGVEVDDAAEPGAHSLIVVTPLGRDATHVIAAQGLDARRTVGFDGLFPGRSVRCLFANPGWDPAWTERARAAFHASGTHVHLVRDSVGLIAQRVLSHVVNVACSIAERRIAAPAEVDRAVVLGLAYPEGPLAWGDILGASQVHAMLAAMLAATGDPRYRPATWLTRRAALGLSLLQAD